MLDGGLWATRGHREPAGRRASRGGQGCLAPENHAPGVPREAAPMPRAPARAQSLSPTSCYVSGARKPPAAGGCCAGSARAAPMMAGRLAQLRRTGWASPRPDLRTYPREQHGLTTWRTVAKTKGNTAQTALACAPQTLFSLTPGPWTDGRLRAAESGSSLRFSQPAAPGREAANSVAHDSFRAPKGLAGLSAPTRPPITSTHQS